MYRDLIGEEWVVLDTYLNWNEPVPVGYEEYEHPHKRLIYEIQSYFVPNEQVDDVIDWVAGKGWGQWLPKCSDQYQIFSREYYWSPAYKYFDNPYYGRTFWQEVDEDSKIGLAMVTSETHRWESGFGEDEHASYIAPREYMFKQMGLQYSSLVGEWLDEAGQVVCFDPSVNRQGCQSLIIKKDTLERFLVKNNLSIVWNCLGEKNIHGNSYSPKSEKIEAWIQLHGVFKLESSRLTGKCETHFKKSCI